MNTLKFKMFFDTKYNWIIKSIAYILLLEILSLANSFILSNSSILGWVTVPLCLFLLFSFAYACNLHWLEVIFVFVLIIDLNFLSVSPPDWDIYFDFKPLSVKFLYIIAYGSGAGMIAIFPILLGMGAEWLGRKTENEN